MSFNLHGEAAAALEAEEAKHAERLEAEKAKGLAAEELEKPKIAAFEASIRAALGDDLYDSLVWVPAGRDNNRGTYRTSFRLTDGMISPGEGFTVTGHETAGSFVVDIPPSVRKRGEKSSFFVSSDGMRVKVLAAIGMYLELRTAARAAAEAAEDRNG